MASAMVIGSHGLFESLQHTFGRLVLATLDELVPTNKIIRVTLGELLGERSKKAVALACAVVAGSVLLKRYSIAVETFIVDHFTCTVHIGPWEQINRDVLDWAHANKIKQKSKSLEVRYPLTQDDEKKTVIELVPGMGSHFFTFRGKFFRITRTEVKKDPGIYLNSKFVDHPEQSMAITCLGWDPNSLQAFLKECSNFSSSQAAEITRIHRSGQEAHATWNQLSERHSRPMSTIDMDDTIKENLLQDAQRYFHSSAKHFYANRGIPLRRGYIFWGPPGCGKSSITQALAGHFKVPLYTASLAAVGMSDDKLERLFEGLPDRSIILLEDIDSAGISRESMTKGAKENDKQKGVTLSGLLNVIDGVSAPEGRLLIMTSNTPDTLDAALIRPGRVDKKIYFGHVSQAVASSIFTRMFTVGPEEQFDAVGQELLHPDHLLGLAKVFAAQIPEQLVTPAETQCYLLDHRNDPAGAVEKAAEWIAELTEQKERTTSTEQDSSDRRPAEVESGSESFIGGLFDKE